MAKGTNQGCTATRRDGRDETDETVSNVCETNLLRRFQESLIFYLKKSPKNTTARKEKKKQVWKSRTRSVAWRPPCAILYGGPRHVQFRMVANVARGMVARHAHMSCVMGRVAPFAWHSHGALHLEFFV